MDAVPVGRSVVLGLPVLAESKIVSEMKIHFMSKIVRRTHTNPKKLAVLINVYVVSFYFIRFDFILHFVCLFVCFLDSHLAS